MTQITKNGLIQIPVHTTKQHNRIFGQCKKQMVVNAFLCIVCLVFVCILGGVIMVCPGPTVEVEPESADVLIPRPSEPIVGENKKGKLCKGR